ncbi:methyltransferase domain-containing protein [Solirubrobacter phytolaccae]|uniref:Methyltransferase domain-containing protein n=1 Tax=Solirubrobacter phytolaccae TaxID=1404360 RepID=A0A9X3S9D8_9ACTN|nr:methyltransferase domain-containing protein [Solirubrobacter phytolaccae]MDA0183304.1 methyltransferase domain-containing protein [Solirubrobacter phytolaccae]
MDQKTRWNTTGGNAWVEMQDLLDRAMAPFIPPLIDGVAGSVLDVGCGTGSTTEAVARQADRAVGVDISAPMIEAARKRTDAAEFIVADAQSHPFHERFDFVISRFGVMFFEDPVAAFTNLARAGTHLRVIAWRGAEDNPFHTTAERAAKPLMPDLPDRTNEAAGQFAFGNADRVRGILTQAGWSDVELQPLDVESTMPEDALEGYYTRLGPVGMALQEANDTTRARVIEVVRPAFDPFLQNGEVRYTAACWIITANSENP